MAKKQGDAARAGQMPLLLTIPGGGGTKPQPVQLSRKSADEPYRKTVYASLSSAGLRKAE